MIKEQLAIRTAAVKFPCSETVPVDFVIDRQGQPDGVAAPRLAAVRIVLVGEQEPPNCRIERQCIPY